MMWAALGMALATAHGAAVDKLTPDMAHNMRILQRAMDPGMFSNYQRYLHSYSAKLSQEQATEQAEEEQKAAQMREQVLAKQRQMQQPMQQAGANSPMQPMQPMTQPMPMQSQEIFGQTMPQPAAPITVSYLPGQQSIILPGQSQQQLRGPAPPSPAQMEARRNAERERQQWASPAIFNNYKAAMKIHSAPPIPDEVQKEYHPYEGKNVLCGPVPLRPIKLSEAGDLEACRAQCSQLVTCVGFITDLAQTKCLFRSWDSLQTCKKRYRTIMQSDEKMVTLLKNNLILDGFSN